MWLGRLVLVVDTLDVLGLFDFTVFTDVFHDDFDVFFAFDLFGQAVLNVFEGEGCLRVAGFEFEFTVRYLDDLIGHLIFGGETNNITT